VGLDVPPFDGDVQQKLREILPAAGTGLRNPVDIGVPLVGVEAFERVLESVASADCIDMIIATQAMFHVLGGSFGPPPGKRERWLQGLVETPARVRDRCGKPIVIVLPVGSDELQMVEAEKGRREIRDQYLSMGIPSYPTLERAARAVANVATYYAKAV
jgi:acyl-CoA synthetase (NDP forming)